MNKKRIITILVFIIAIVAVVVCLELKPNKKKNIIQEMEVTPPVKQEDFDYSNSLDNIDTIKNETITEARIYWADKIYSTTDEEIVGELVDRISALKLEEISENDVEKTAGYYELFLLNENKVVYHFLSADYLSVGKKDYGPKEQVLYFDNEIIGYCRETFWKD